ncbi:aldose epimerase family protein [Methyloligella solikamskensis]|uniref:Aldose 1-epimerase n=1 Tax=Methyloligella solikamskensis TaxID=1177756 RepID=A0ABW3J7L3_9HYPH
MLARSYGTMPDGTPVELFSLGRAPGLVAHVITYGGTIVGLDVPDRDGVDGNVVLNLASLSDYVAQEAYLCALVGRYANRIGGAAFTLDGTEYHLSDNDNGDCLHGGRVGFNRCVWQVVEWKDAPEPRLTLRHVSPDGDQGFPGTLRTEVTYTVTGGDTLAIDFRAETDRPTVLNLINHTYFNLSGPGSGDVLDHEVTIAADRFTPIDADEIPTGELRDVAGTPFDFRTPHTIGACIDDDDPQLKYASGYDHNFVLADTPRRTPQFAARCFDPRSGRVLEVHTTQPGLQLYSGNHLDGSLKAPGGAAYGPRTAVCFETQHFPDSPNRPDFPSTVLRPGQNFASRTEYRFATA